MYASFFGFRELPFNNTPDPRFFFSTPDHEEALASLIYAISERKGFVLLTGEVGSGKTLVSRLMLRHFGDAITFAQINSGQVTPTELLQAICREFEIETLPTAGGAELSARLQDYLVGNFAENRTAVLLLDEAQVLSRESFEQVRMIGNLEADDAKLIQIVIVGQPELRDRFSQPDMRQLRQRLFRSFHLSGLSADQVRGYIHHRLSVAGAQRAGEIFNDDAIELVAKFTEGLPRLINAVCDNALLSAYASDQRQVNRECMQGVIQQMMLANAPTPRLRGKTQCTAVPINAPYRQPDQARRLAQPATRRPDRSRTDGDITQLTAQVRALQRSVTALRSAQESRGSDTGGGHLSEPGTVTERTAQAVHTLLDSARATISEGRTLLEQMQAAQAETIQAHRATRRTTEKLNEQIARAGRLTMTLRSVFDRIESRTARFGESKTVRESSAQPVRPEQPAAPSAIESRAHALAHNVQQSRQTIDEIARLIRSTAELSTATDSSIDLDDDALVTETTALELADRVRSLTETVYSAPHGQVAAD